MSDNDTHKLQVHRMEILVMDHDAMGAKRSQDLLEHTEYANHAPKPTVLSCETKTIDYNDDHPLNLRDREKKLAAAGELFGAKIDITPEQLAAMERLWVAALFMKGMLLQLKLQQPDGEIMLAVIAKKKDGTGAVGPSWEPEEFFNDLETLKGIKLP